MTQIEKSILLQIKKRFSVTKFYKEPGGYLASIDQVPTQKLLKQVGVDIINIIEQTPACNGLDPIIDYEAKVTSHYAIGYLDLQFSSDYEVDSKIREVSVKLSAHYYHESDTGSIVVSLYIDKF